MSAHHYDYIIIGAGSAGCVLAHRLSANPMTRVLVLEAGGWDGDPLIHIPLGWGRILLNRMHDWMYFAQAESSVNDRAVECARGKVIGGSSSINAMAYVRGHQSDYQRWAKNDLPTWDFSHVLPYFKKTESWQGGDDLFRGGHGPLTTQYCRYDDPLIDAYMSAGQQAGFALNDDYNGWDQEGFARWQMTIRKGRRCSAATAYLHPISHRPNLTILTKAQTVRILCAGERALGVEFFHHNKIKTAYAERETVLSAGVINSPQLLMLSGIGDPDHLTAMNIKPIIKLKGVGQNLQDHMSVALFYERQNAGPLHRRMRVDRIGLDLVKAYLFGKGIANDLPAGCMAFLRTDASQAIPDVQFLFNAAPLAAQPYLAPFVKPYKDGFATRVVGLRPESRGTIALRSNDPLAAPIIKQNFFAHDNDILTLRRGVRLAQEVARQTALKPFIKRALSLCDDNSDQAVDDYIRSTAITVHHPLGTCKMSGRDDDDGVVDAELKVRGIKGLRVVDASIMPDLIGGNINAAVMMIAEKAADLILNAD